jgi:glutathione-specific gamma-glutamylcyclotransferase
MTAPKTDLFLFGYGSLMFRTNFKYDSWEPAYVKGFERVFYQGSTDHRGVPGKPGRVVTMLPKSDSLVAGVLFRISAAHRDEAVEALDLREKAGYAQYSVPCYRYVADAPYNDATLLTNEALCYIATADNEEFLGHATNEAIADEVSQRAGPSGPNSEYVIKMAEVLRLLGVDDDHVHGIETHLKQRLGIDEPLSLITNIPL